MNNMRFTRVAARRRTSGSTRAGFLALGCLLIGGGVGSYVAFRAASPAPAPRGSDIDVDGLSEQTRGMLAQLQVPIEIHYYSILDPQSSSDSEQAFAGRVRNLLDEYQKNANGNIKVKHYDKPSNAAANAAREHGIQPFNIDKGDGCYLGVAIERDGRRQTLPRLLPQWEHVLESDLTRAIVATAPVGGPVVTEKVDPDAAAQVRSTLPNLDTLSREEGNRILRAEALKEFKTTAEELQRQVQGARQAFVDAQSTQSDAEKEQALARMRQAQAAETEKLKEITARLQAKLIALDQLKSQSH